MKNCGSKYLVLIILVAFNLPQPSVSSEYMPLDQGWQWTYSDAVEANVGESQTIHGNEAVPLTFWWPEYNGLQYWLTDDAAGPMLQDITVYDASFDGQNWLLESWSLGFESSIRLFELPLTPGAELFDIVSSDLGEIDLLRTVGPKELLETPYGDLSAYRIHVQDLSGLFPSTVFYVHAELGPVGFNGSLLTDFTGVVEVKQRTLSNVKSLFR